MSIGERITELRTLTGMSQLQLAREMEVSRQAVSKWENDQSAPDSLKMIRLAEILETDVEYLTTGRRNFSRRPPVVVNTVETVEKIVEKPVIQIVEKTVEKVVEKPVIQYVEKPVIQKRIRIKYLRNPIEYILWGLFCFILGFIAGMLR